jgi:two-component system cell cycle response regulator DivK
MRFVKHCDRILTHKLMSGHYPLSRPAAHSRAPVTRFGSNRRLLLIDECEFERQLLCDHLRLEGYRVYTLANDSTCTATITAFRPHLILLNLTHNSNSLALLSQIRQHPEWLHIPVVVLSSLAFQSDLQKAMSLGADRYLIKPVNLADLQQVLQEELQTSTAIHF